MNGDPPTSYQHGELARRLDELARIVERREEKTAERFDKIAERIEEVLFRIEERYVSTDKHTALSERVKKIEDRSEWLVRIVGAIVLAAVLSLVVVAGGDPSP